MIGDDMDKAVTDIVSLMVTMARFNGDMDPKPIPVNIGNDVYLLKLEKMDDKPVDEQE